MIRLLVCTILALAAGTAPQAARATDADAGAALYGRYCATCHGNAGLGDGPTGRIISVLPTDLTRLAADNGGAFPLERVLRRIDGREKVVAHGSPMPIYGAFFEGSTSISIETGQGQTTASAPVFAIARFLETIQRQ